MNRSKPWQVVRLYPGGGVAVISGHRSFRVAEAHAYLRDAYVAVHRAVTGIDMGESYDVRPDPRPEPAPLTEKWGGPPAQ